MVNYKNKYLKYKLKYFNLQNGGMNLEEDLERLRFESIFELINLVIFGVERYGMVRPYPVNIKIKNLEEGINIINAYFNNNLSNYTSSNYSEIFKDLIKKAGGYVELIESKTFSDNRAGRPYFDITQLNEKTINELFDINVFEIIRENGKIKAYIKKTI